MLPLHVFKSRNFCLTMALTFFVGLGLFGAMTFLPLYQQTVQGATPDGERPAADADDGRLGRSPRCWPGMP